MKVLELGKFYPPERGGIETLLKLWCEGFVAAGDEVDCVVANTTARTVTEGEVAFYTALFGGRFTFADEWHNRIVPCPDPNHHLHGQTAFLGVLTHPSRAMSAVVAEWAPPEGEA